MAEQVWRSRTGRTYSSETEAEQDETHSRGHNLRSRQTINFEQADMRKAAIAKDQDYIDELEEMMILKELRG